MTGEIARQTLERAFAKDEALWKGYAEVNFENPSKVKKNLKLSKRILAVTRYRLYFFKVKKCDFDSEYSLLDCVKIIMVKPQTVTLVFKKGFLDRDRAKLEMIDKGKMDVGTIKGLKYVNISTDDNRHVERMIIKTIRESIRHSTDSWPVARLTIDSAIPSDWLVDLDPYKPGIACGVLSSYLAVSDYRSKYPDPNFQLFVKCAVSDNSKELILSDCPGVDTKAWTGAKTGVKPTFDFVVISEILEFNTYFEALVIQNINQKDAAEACAGLMMRNKTLKKIVIKNCNTTFGSDFGYSLFYNKQHSLTVIDLSHNSMPHNGAIPMAHSFISLQHVIKVLCLASMDISPKGFMALANAFSSNWGMSIGLEEVDVSNNNSDSAATEAWVSWLRNIGADSRLRRLSLANTGMAGNLIMPTLAAIPLQYLDVSGLKYGKEEDTIPKFVSDSKTIRVLRLSESGLSADCICKVLQALPKNKSIPSFHLDVSKNQIGTAGGNLLALTFSDLTTLQSLNIATMGLKGKGLLPVITALPVCVETFICDDNFETSTEIEQEELAFNFAKLVSSHDKLSNLSIDAKKGKNMGVYLTRLFKLLKTNTTLVHLNISNQGCGDTAISQLCRALYKNTKLLSLKFPGNNLSYNGILAFEQALLNNTTLKFIEFFDDKELPYEKMCVGTNKFANDLLLVLHQKCILRRAGVNTKMANLFDFDSVAWDTPQALTPLLPVPPRLASIKSTTDWNALEAEVQKDQPAPAATPGGDDDDAPQPSQTQPAPPADHVDHPGPLKDSKDSRPGSASSSKKRDIKDKGKKPK